MKELVAADPSLAIFAAAIQGDTEHLTELLTENRSLVGLLSTDGWTPLHLAAFFGKTEAARLSIKQRRHRHREIHQPDAEHAPPRRRIGPSL